MFHRHSDRHRAGFTGLFTTEVAVVTLLYALYPCAVLAFARRLPFSPSEEILSLVLTASLRGATYLSVTQSADSL